MKQLTVLIASIPEGTEPNEPIYMASNMNGWKTNDPAFQLVWQPESGYFILPLDNCPDRLEFKFARGSWATEEIDANNNRMLNRLWVSSSGDKILHHINCQLERYS